MQARVLASIDHRTTSNHIDSFGDCPSNTSQSIYSGFQLVNLLVRLAYPSQRLRPSGCGEPNRGFSGCLDCSVAQWKQDGREMDEKIRRFEGNTAAEKPCVAQPTRGRSEGLRQWWLPGPWDLIKVQSACVFTVE